MGASYREVYKEVWHLVGQDLEDCYYSEPKDTTCTLLFSSVRSVFEGRVRNAGVKVDRRDRAHKPAKISEGDIRQVLSNLLGNAIDAMSVGGRLLVRSREATNWRSGQKGLMLTVADTGSGMPGEVLRRVFEPFYTTKGVVGTGLGLWVSKDIVDRHKGTLKFRSSQREAHRGTVVELFLPYETAEG